MSKENNLPEIQVKVVKLTDSGSDQKEKSENFSGTHHTTPYSYKTLAKLLEENVFHGRCIEVKTAGICGSGFDIVAEKGVEFSDQDPEYLALQEFVDNHPNYAGQTLEQTFMNYAQDWQIFGDGYLECTTNKKPQRTIEEIFHMPSINIQLKTSKELKNKNRHLRRVATQKIDAKETDFYPLTTEHLNNPPKKRNNHRYNLYIRQSTYSPSNTIYGVPKYVSALLDLALHRSIGSYSISFINNNGVPAFAVIVENGNLTDDQFSLLQQQLLNNKGPENAGKAFLLQTGKKKGSASEKVSIKIEELAKMPKDAFFRMLRLDSRDDIVAAHGVPPRLAGVPSSNKLGDTSETDAQMRLLTKITLPNLRKQFEFTINHFLVKIGLRVSKYKFQFNPLDLTDAKDYADFYQKMLTSKDENGESPFTADEVRGMFNMEPKSKFTGDGKKDKINVEKEEHPLVLELRKFRKSIESNI